MAIRKEDWVNIRQEIDAALKEHLNPHGWRKAFHVLREWAPLGGILTVVLGLIAIIVALVIGVANRREADGKFQGSTETRLTAIEKRLDIIQQSFAASLLKNQASLPQTEFQERLPDLKSAVTIARESKVKGSADTMNTLRSKLLQTKPNSSDYWPTVSDFISYQSFALSPISNLQDLLQANLPNCTDRDPEPQKLIGVQTGSPGKFELSAALYQDCRITLDSAHDDDRINYLITRSAMLIEFRQCLVVYRGGEVNLILAVKNHHNIIQFSSQPQVEMDATYTGNTLVFTKCLSEVAITGAPPLKGEQLTKTLLAQNFSEPVQLPLAK